MVKESYAIGLDDLKEALQDTFTPLAVRNNSMVLSSSINQNDLECLMDRQSSSCQINLEEIMTPP